jgi:hypothetical protein
MVRPHARAANLEPLGSRKRWEPNEESLEEVSSSSSRRWARAEQRARGNKTDLEWKQIQAPLRELIMLGCWTPGSDEDNLILGTVRKSNDPAPMSPPRLQPTQREADQAIPRRRPTNRDRPRSPQRERSDGAYYRDNRAYQHREAPRATQHYNTRMLPRSDYRDWLDRRFAMTDLELGWDCLLRHERNSTDHRRGYAEYLTRREENTRRHESSTYQAHANHRPSSSSGRVSSYNNDYSYRPTHQYDSSERRDDSRGYGGSYRQWE